MTKILIKKKPLISFFVMMGMALLGLSGMQGCKNSVASDSINILKMNIPDSLMGELDSVLVVVKNSESDGDYIQKEIIYLEAKDSSIKFELNSAAAGEFYLEITGFSKGEISYHQGREMQLMDGDLKVAKVIALLNKEPENKNTSFHFIRQPRDQNANKNQSAFFSVEIDSLEGALFQWQKDGQNISGENAADLEYENSGEEDDESEFRVIVTRNNFKDTSGIARLFINEIPNLSIPLAKDDSLSLSEEDSVVFAASDFTKNDSDGDEDRLVVYEIFFSNNIRGNLNGGNVTLIGKKDFYGEDSLGYIVSDQKGGYDTAYVFVSVAPVNDAPVLKAMDTLMVEENELLSFTIEAEDVEGDSFVFRLLEFPTGMDLDSLSGNIKWTPGLSDEGLNVILVEAVDFGSPSESDSLRIWIEVENYDVPSIGFSVSSLSGGEKDSAGVTLLLSQAAKRDIYVSLRTSGTASKNLDYSLSDSVFRFTAGETSKSFTIYVENDDLEEGDENILIEFDSLFNVVAGQIKQHTYTIADDETLPEGVIVVDSATDVENGDGLSWSTPFETLSKALEARWGEGSASGKPAEIWIAGGTYFPGATREESFILPADVTIYGGFAGGESQLSQRNFSSNVSLLSGKLPGGDTAVHVALIGNGGTTILDGIYVSHGYARGGGSKTVIGKSWSDNVGGGLYVSGATLVVRNCVFTENKGIDNSAIYVSDGDSLHMENSFVMENGGGDVIENGGGSIVEGWSFYISNSVFYKNYATAVTIQESKIDLAFSNITHSVFYKNKSPAGSTPGAFDIYDNGTHGNRTTISYSIIWENGDILSEASQMMFRNGGYQPYIYNSVAFGRQAQAFKHLDEFSGVQWSGTIITEDPEFINPSNPYGEDGLLFTQDDGLNILSSSPAVDIISTEEYLEPELDILGFSRIQGEGPDMGAYEQ